MSQHFQRIGLISKAHASVAPTLGLLVDLLQNSGCEILLDPVSSSLLPDAKFPLATGVELAGQVDLLISVGGDGTLLGAARSLVDQDAPLLGINQGRMGFLADISPAKMQEHLTRILQGDYQTEQRFLLRTEIRKNSQVIATELALNDAVFHKWNTARLIEFEIFVNGHFIDFQRSDGLIIATPTGSSAYALSAGGPLMEPALDALLLVPICPHTIGNRPILVAGSSYIELKVWGNTDPANVRISCDGQAELAIDAEETLHISRYPKPIRLIHPSGQTFFDIIRTKLGWGKHQENVKPC
jgi:NAD+ kinase